ncbi:MAG TPA: hypothetical protein VN861_16120 [Candidatus Acidoferrales bacterium]|nr:hypothetical protein [Candidatus Acidoferrales bacterium]
MSTMPWSCADKMFCRHVPKCPLNEITDSAALRKERMLTSAKLFQLLNESIVLLLGALLILLAVSGRVGLPARPAALIALGIVFIYWGLRAWMRHELSPTRWPSKIRAASLALVGALILSIPVFPARFIPVLLGLAGAVLLLRGALGAVFFAKTG